MPDTPDQTTSTPEDGASAPVESVSSSTVPASVRIASVGGLVRAKVRMVGAWSASRRGQRVTGQELNKDCNDSI